MFSYLKQISKYKLFMKSKLFPKISVTPFRKDTFFQYIQTRVYKQIN